MLEVIAIEAAERRYLDFELSAFDGWQRHLLKAKKPLNFERYKKNLGIRKPGKVQGSRKKAIADARRVMQEIGLADVLGIRPTSDSQSKH